MNILAPLAAGLALAPTAVKVVGNLAHQLSFSQFLSSPPALPAEPAAPKDATSDAQLEEFRKLLHDRLSLAGVDLSDPVTLGMTSWGEIEVRSPHLQATEIEDLLNSDPDLMRRFYQTAALASGAPLDPQILGSEWNELDQFELTVR